jgi:hypothetical protein
MPTRERRSKVTKPHHITITLLHCINGGTGRVDSKRHAALRGHDETAFEWLRRTVRGYRGPSTTITETYATKVQSLAVAAGFAITVKEQPKPTPAKGRAVQRTMLAYMKSRAEISTRPQ